MKTFIDSVTGEAWQFEDSDDLRLIDGVYQLFDVFGYRITSVPDTLAPGELTQPVDPPPSLDDLKAAKRIEINNACLAAIDGGFEHDGHVYDSDERSKSNIIGTATGVTAGIPLPDGFAWRTHDNEDIPMDGPGVIALGAALLMHVNTQYEISWQLKALVDAATTPEDLDAISWPMADEPPQAA